MPLAVYRLKRTRSIFRVVSQTERAHIVFSIPELELPLYELHQTEQ